MRIWFHNHDYLKSINHFCELNDLGDNNKLIIADDTTNNWVNIHPACLAFAAAMASSIGKENTEIITSLPLLQEYLGRMGLYGYAKNDCPVDFAQKESSGSYIPIANIRNEAEQSKFILELHPILHMPPNESNIIKYVLGELIRNVIEHSKSPSGAFVSVRYVPDKHKVSIGICDTGVGLRASLEKFHHPKDDLDAIRKALMPGISGTTGRSGGTEVNAGAGLYIVKSIAKSTRDYFFIYSGDSAYKLHLYDQRIVNPRYHEDPFAEKCSVYDSLPSFGGTLVGIDISTNQTEAFSAILEKIKQSYSSAIQNRRKKQYKEIKFI